MVIIRIGPSQRLKLIDDRLHVRMRVALDEHLRKEVRHRGRTERRAQILKGVAPAIVDALLLIGGDARSTGSSRPNIRPEWRARPAPHRRSLPSTPAPYRPWSG